MLQIQLGDSWSVRLVSTADVNPAKGGPEIFSGDVFRGDGLVFSFRLRGHTDGRPPDTTVLDKMEEAIQVIRREALPKQTVDFKRLSLGARFRYAGTSRVWVKIDAGTIALWGPDVVDWAGQPVCSYSDGPEDNPPIELA